MKTTKVISVWGGRRAWQPEDYPIDHNLKMLELTVAHEKTLYYGMPMDLILINSVPNHPKEGYKKYVNLLNSLDGSSTKNGIVKVLHKENLGISNGAFDYVFRKYMDDYDYWYFSEDDRINIANKVMRIAVDMMENDEDIGFIATTGIRKSPRWRFYALGSSGITSTKVLKQVLSLGLNREEDGTDHLPFCWKPVYKRGPAAKGSLCWHKATHAFTTLIKYQLGLELSRIVYNGILLANQPVVKDGAQGVSVNYGAFLAHFYPELFEEHINQELNENYQKEIKEYVAWFHEGS